MWGDPTLDFSTLNIITDILGTSSINLAANTERSSENLLNRAFQLFCKGLESHCARDLDDLIKRNRLAVLDVLLLLSIAGRLLQGFNDKG